LSDAGGDGEGPPLLDAGGEGNGAVPGLAGAGGEGDGAVPGLAGAGGGDVGGAAHLLSSDPPQSFLFPAPKNTNVIRAPSLASDN
jgi:hypothetical protein